LSDGARFGRSVSISETQIAIGAPLDSSNGVHSGSVYIYDLNGVEVKKLTSSSASSPYEQFGASVKITGEILCVGAIYAGEGTDTQGAMYIFKNAQ